MNLLEIGTSFWLISILSEILEPIKIMGTYKNNWNLSFRIGFVKIKKIINIKYMKNKKVKNIYEK